MSVCTGLSPRGSRFPLWLTMTLHYGDLDTSLHQAHGITNAVTADPSLSEDRSATFYMCYMDRHIW